MFFTTTETYFPVTPMRITTKSFNVNDPRLPATSTWSGHRQMEQMLRLHTPWGLIREMSLVQSGQVLEGRLAPMDIDTYLQFALDSGTTGEGLWQQLGPGGKGWAVSGAMMSALGETVERLTPVFTNSIRKEELEVASPRELRGRGFPIPAIESLAPLHIAQNLELSDLTALTDDTQIGWYRARTLFGGEETWAPAQQVCFRYQLAPQEPAFVVSTSVGLAAGYDKRHALLGAINELVERDVIGLSWHCNLPAERIPLDQIHFRGEAGRIAEMLRRVYPDIVVLRHPTDLSGFTVLSVHRFAGENVTAAFSAGSAASTSPEKAFLGAATEFFQSENTAIISRELPRWQTDRVENKFETAGAQRDAIASVNDRMSFYGVSKNYEHARQRLEPDRLGSLESLPLSVEEEYECAVGCLKRHGIDPVIFEYDQAPLFSKGGVVTVRVLIPNLTLPHVPPYRFFGHPRYFEIRKTLGITESLDTFEDLSLEENPFP